MARRERHIVAMGGGGLPLDDPPLLDDYLLRLTGKERPRVCFVPTAAADADAYVARFYRSMHADRCHATDLALFTRTVTDLRSFLLRQDVIYVSGGNTANLLAIWRVHGVDAILREAWEAGIVLGGPSAGGLCWFDGGVTDSFGPGLAALHDGLGFLAGSFCPHYDSEPQRRPTYQRLVAAGELPADYAADDGVSLHFAGTDLAAVVSAHPNARAYRVERRGDAATETALPTTYLG
jgi:dipeptidase E